MRDGLGRRTFTCALIPLIVAFAHLASANQRGVAVSGIVEDKTAVGIPSATVMLIDVATGKVRQTTADRTGRFSFPAVEPGDYIVRAEGKLQGFAPSELPISVGADPPAPITLRLEIGFQQEVTVTASRTHDVKTDDNANAPSFDTNLLAGLPLSMNSNSLLNFIGTFLSLAAQGTDEVSVLVDGVETPDFTLPTFAIKKMIVNKNPYAAEYRRPGKARVEILTRDGSRRRTEGGLGITFRNDALDARNAFSDAKPRSTRELYQASFGGPVFGAGADFFVSGQYSSDRQNLLVNAETPDGPLVEFRPTTREFAYGLGRIDFHPSPMHSLTFSYDYGTQRGEVRGGGFNVSRESLSTDYQIHRAQIADRQVVTPWFANEFRASFEALDQRQGRRASTPAIIVTETFATGTPQPATIERHSQLEAREILTMLRGSHMIRLGARYRTKQVSASDASNFGGTFIFSTLENYRLGRPLRFQVTQGDPDVSFRRAEGEAFIQDEFSLHSSLTLMLGARYDWQSDLIDNNNVAPRVALAFAPFGSGDRRPTTVRAGYGLFYERLPDSVPARSRLFDGSRLRDLRISNPSYPDPFLAGAQTEPPPSIVRVAPDIQTPYLAQTSVGVDQRLWPHGMLTLEYAWLRGVHLFRARDINAPLPGTTTRQDPAYVHILQAESSARMRGQATSVGLQAQLGSWLRGTAEYTWSTSRNDTKGAEPGAGFPFSLPADNYNLAAEWGRADYDRKHHVTFAGVGQVPGAIRIGAVLEYGSEMPYDITTGFDDNGDGEDNDRPSGVTRNTGRGPDLFNLDLRLTKLFGAPHVFRNPARANAKNLEITLDVFNALNRTNYRSYIGVLSSPFYGRPVAARDPRTLQLSLKYGF